MINRIIKDTEHSILEVFGDRMVERPKDTTEESKDRIVKILEESSKLSKDSIAAVVVLEHINEGNIALMNLIKTNKVEAIYKGDKTKPFNIDSFVFKLI